MKTKLIQALREAAKLIVTTDYSWLDLTRCNCGILACAIVGRRIERDEIPLRTGSIWSDVCETTGMPLTSMFKALLAAGLTLSDFRHIEMCNDARVLKRLGSENNDHSKPQFVARYFTAWADMLEEESQPFIPTTTQDQIATIEARDVLMENVKHLEPA